MQGRDRPPDRAGRVAAAARPGRLGRDRAGAPAPRPGRRRRRPPSSRWPGSPPQHGVTLGSTPRRRRATGDALRLRQLVTILVDNAIRHSPSGGTVTVVDRAGRRQGDDHRHRRGPGHPARGPAPRLRALLAGAGRATGGAGLGLSIARWIVERHGGTIEASSPAGSGARFEVTPARELKSSRIVPSKTARAPDRALPSLPEPGPPSRALPAPRPAEPAQALPSRPSGPRPSSPGPAEPAQALPSTPEFLSKTSWSDSYGDSLPNSGSNRWGPGRLSSRAEHETTSALEDPGRRRPVEPP